MDYRTALESAVIYIENHLGDDIQVEEVARVAGYSYYHLSRQFTAILGESIGSYIKKRRLAEAAKRLIYSDQKIIDLAMDMSFESSEAFSRAFKLIYNVSPQQYRKNKLDVLIGSKERLDKGLLDHLARNVTVHPKIVELPEIKVAGLRGETTLRDLKLRELWDKANASYRQIPHRVSNARAFGICEACLNNTLYTMNDDVVFSEVAGIEVQSFEGLSEPFVKKVIPGGRYAVFTHRGSLRMLPQTFDYIWGTWFLTSKEEIDDREDLEMYDERFLGYDHPDSEVDLYIPVK
ncbi:MAG: AraC family transcriptional regulator [Streptococcaceae bacterium]|jgi:AraC family transcriptional regulator|nr:AraC family transcriptional regulator [Streptococcaceae bacterium]